MLIKGDCFEYLSKIEKNSIDLILVDPPYGISRDSNFSNSKSADKETKNRFDFSIDFGEWDQEVNLDELFKQYYRILKPGGTLIIFYDIWKSSYLKDIADKYKFKQPRVCVWQKSNPVPINSKRNYLSNACEYFFSFVKKGKPTFNSEYDSGNYKFPLCHGKERLDHPTQKPLKLIEEIIKKHSNEGDIILDSFAGTGTTGEACINLNRKYILIENNEDYFNIIKERIG